MSLKIPEDEIGRFLAAYHRGIFPKGATVGNCFLFYYGISGYPHIRNESNEEKAIQLIVKEFAGPYS